MELISCSSQNTLFYLLLDTFCWKLTSTWRFTTFQLFNSNLSPKGTRPSCMYLYLSLFHIVNHMYIQQKNFFHLFEVLWESENSSITLLILYHVSSMFVTLLKLIMPLYRSLTSLFFLHVEPCLGSVCYSMKHSVSSTSSVPTGQLLACIPIPPLPLSP